MVEVSSPARNRLFLKIPPPLPDQPVRLSERGFKTKSVKVPWSPEEQNWLAGGLSNIARDESITSVFAYLRAHLNNSRTIAEIRRAVALTMLKGRNWS